MISPQCRHFLAVFLISSEQYGQSIVSVSATSLMKEFLIRNEDLCQAIGDPKQTQFEFPKHEHVLEDDF